MEGGFGSAPVCKGMARPAPHPVAATRQPSKTQPASQELAGEQRGRQERGRQERRVLRSAKKLTGKSVASHNIPGRCVSGRDVCAVEETPVRTVTEIVVALPSATVEGVMLQVELAGNPVHVNVAVPETLAAELSSNG